MRDTVYKSECKMVRSKKGTLVPVTRVIRIPANKYGFERKEIVGETHVEEQSV